MQQQTVQFTCSELTTEQDYALWISLLRPVCRTNIHSNGKLQFFIIIQLDYTRRTIMAKGQQRKNKETKKPKKETPK
jgi:hypothetical protein